MNNDALQVYGRSGLLAYALSPEFLKLVWADLVPDQAGHLFLQPAITSGANPDPTGRHLALLFFGLLFLAMPFVTLAEERVFRAGHLEWRAKALQRPRLGAIYAKLSPYISSS